MQTKCTYIENWIKKPTTSHTAAIQARMRYVEGKFQRERLGWPYFLLHPGSLIAKLKEYRTLVDKQFQMYR